MRYVLAVLILASVASPAYARKPKRIRPNAWFAEPARVSPFDTYWAQYGKPLPQPKQPKPKKAKKEKDAPAPARTQDVEPAGPQTIVNPYFFD